MCPAQPLHIPGNATINRYLFSSWNASEDGDGKLLDYYREHDSSCAGCVVQVICWVADVAFSYCTTRVLQMTDIISY